MRNTVYISVLFFSFLLSACGGETTEEKEKECDESILMEDSTLWAAAVDM